MKRRALCLNVIFASHLCFDAKKLKILLGLSKQPPSLPETTRATKTAATQYCKQTHTLTRPLFSSLNFIARTCRTSRRSPTTTCTKTTVLRSFLAAPRTYPSKYRLFAQGDPPFSFQFSPSLSVHSVLVAFHLLLIMRRSLANLLTRQGVGLIIS